MSECLYNNKNTLTGLANCKKTKIQLCHFSTFIVPNFMQKIRKILRAVSEKTALPTNQPTKYQSIWFWANLETLSRISPNQEFFQKYNSVTFLPLYSPNLMQKIRKILRAVSEKTVLPTNQPTKYQCLILG